MSGRVFDIIACGDDALRILCGEGDVRHALAEQLRGDAYWMEVVPGKQDVTVAFDPHAEPMGAAEGRLQKALAALSIKSVSHDTHHVLSANFDSNSGPDLASLAQRLGMGELDLVEKVEQSLLSVDMLGFTPGFAYLTGLDPALQASRLDHPRASVPAGSIGLITGQIGLYALDGPGGWPIIGRVLSPLFVRLQADPFLLKAGNRVSLRRAIET